MLYGTEKKQSLGAADIGAAADRRPADRSDGGLYPLL